jgi:hypothetical protein
MRGRLKKRQTGRFEMDIERPVKLKRACEKENGR